MKRKKVIKFLTTVSFLSLISGTANANGLADNVYVTQIVTQGANSAGVNRVCVYVSDTITDTPACNTSMRFCADIDQPIGQAHLSAALTAYTAKKKVKIAGRGSCDLVTNSEDIDYVFLLNE